MSKMAAYERTFEALRSSMRLLLNVENEQALFDMAAAVADITRLRALDRLETLSVDGRTSKPHHAGPPSGFTLA